MHSNLWPNGKWFRRHLNWTLILYYLIWLAMAGPVVVLDTAIFGEDVSGVFYIWAILFPVGVIYLLVWNLKHKGRSLFNLFYLLIPFGVGWVVFLCINNREQLDEEKMKVGMRKKELEELRKEYNFQTHGNGKQDMIRW